MTKWAVCHDYYENFFLKTVRTFTELDYLNGFDIIFRNYNFEY